VLQLLEQVDQHVADHEGSQLSTEVVQCLFEQDFLVATGSPRRCCQYGHHIRRQAFNRRSERVRLQACERHHFAVDIRHIEGLYQQP